MQQDIIVQKGDVWRISSGVQPAVVRSIRNGEDPVLHGTIAANSTFTVGPYGNVTQFRIESEGNFTLLKLNEDFEAPYTISGGITSNVGGITGATAISNIVQISQVDYDALTTEIKNANTFLIPEA